MKPRDVHELKEIVDQKRENRIENFNSHLEEFRKRRKQRMTYLKRPDFEKLQSLHMKKLTILHSNDLHGDFLAEKVDEGLMGGISMLSGYVSKVRNEEQNVIYAIAGDMFRGSLIDSEFRGISTIEIMNLLTPDVVTVGNHEVDYGLEHLLFLEKCASFPIINANMYVNLREAHLFSPHFIMEVGGLKVLFIGAITEEVLASTKAEELIGTLIDIRDVASEVRKATDAYKTSDIDLTVLLTHIGFEEDKKLAEELGPDCDIDIIIGGHSHTYLEEPCVVAGIPIVQAAVGTDQIGRFDIVFDSRSEQINSYTWELIPVTEENCPRDLALEEVIDKYKQITDSKYLRILTRFAQEYTHNRYDMETDLGDLIAECMRSQLAVDLVMIAAGSIRTESLGPIVTLQDLMIAFPYESSMVGFRLTGYQLRKVVKHLMRDDAIDVNVWTELFQFSNGFFCEYDRSSHEILRLTIDGKEVLYEKIYSIAVQSFFFCSIEEYFGITLEEVMANGKPEELASSMQNVLIDYFDNNDYIKLQDEKRLLIH